MMVDDKSELIIWFLMMVKMMVKMIVKDG